MGAWQARLSAFTVPCLLGGLGFVLGWGMVRFPWKGDDPYVVRPAPAWLLLAGVSLAVFGVAAFAVARLTSPMYDAALPSPRMRRAEPGCVENLAKFAVVTVPLVICALASSGERRWRPLLMVAAEVILVPLLVLPWKRRRSSAG